MSAAFDSIDNYFLINRLHSSFVFWDLVLNWFKLYLCDSPVWSFHIFISSTFFRCASRICSWVNFVYFLHHVSGDVTRKHNLHYHMYVCRRHTIIFEPSNVLEIVVFFSRKLYQRR